MEQTDGHEELALVLTKQEKNCRLLQLLVHEVRGLQQRVTDLEPQTFLPAIESPPNPNNFVNVSRFLREVIDRRNESIPIGGKRYFAFPDDLEDQQLNTDAMMCIEGLLCLHMNEHYGKKTWPEVYEKDRARCERFIQNAKHVPELAVFAQAAAQWAIRRLVESKMKSKLRTEKKRTARKVTRREMQEHSQQENRNFVNARRHLHRIESCQNQEPIGVSNQESRSLTLDGGTLQTSHLSDPSNLTERNNETAGLDDSRRCDSPRAAEGKGTEIVRGTSLTHSRTSRQPESGTQNPLCDNIIPEIENGIIDNGIENTLLQARHEALIQSENIQLGVANESRTGRQEERSAERYNDKRICDSVERGMDAPLTRDGRLKGYQPPVIPHNSRQNFSYKQRGVESDEAFANRVNVPETQHIATDHDIDDQEIHQITKRARKAHENGARVRNPETGLISSPAMEHRSFQNVTPSTGPLALSYSGTPRDLEDTRDRGAARRGITTGRGSTRGLRIATGRGSTRSCGITAGRSSTRGRGMKSGRGSTRMEALRGTVASEEGRLMAPSPQRQSYSQNVDAARSRTVAPNVEGATDIGLSRSREATRGVRTSRVLGAKQNRGISRGQVRRAAQIRALSNARATSNADNIPQ